MGSFKEAVRRAAVFSAVLASGLAACEQPSAPSLPPAATEPRDVDGYLASPTVIAARIEGDRVVLEGLAEKGSRVRLASPQGQAQTTDADRTGRWRIVATPADEPR